MTRKTKMLLIISGMTLAGIASLVAGAILGNELLLILALTLLMLSMSAWCQILASVAKRSNSRVLKFLDKIRSYIANE